LWHSGCRIRVCLKRWAPPLPPPERPSSFVSSSTPPAAAAGGVTDEALEALLEKVWVESKRDPAKSLQPQQIDFVSRLESVCRHGRQQKPNKSVVEQDPQRQWSNITGTTRNFGTWLAYDDPMQDVLSAFDRAQQQQQRQPSLGSRAVAAADVLANNSTRRKHQPVKLWSLRPELRGPFLDTCRPPHWDSLDYNWPREPGAPPVAAKTYKT